MSNRSRKCVKCGVTIQEATALRNEGKCGPCQGRLDLEIRQRQREKELRNRPPPPPPPINYWIFTKKQFVTALHKHLLPHIDDKEELCGEFLGFCDPIMEIRDKLFSGLKRIPRPYRELMAVYQVWGMVCSDGFDNYLEANDRKFDREVDRGFKLFDLPDMCGVVSKARSIYRNNDDWIPEKEDKELWSEFYDPLEKFESDFLGPYLVKLMNA